MLTGTELEPPARAAYEAPTGLVMQPLVLVDGDYSASLDGITLDGERILEIKCPYNGQASSLWQAVEAGRAAGALPLAGAAPADGDRGGGRPRVRLRRHRGHCCSRSSPTRRPGTQVRSAWDAFAALVAKAEPPPLTERDVRVRDDAEWLQAAPTYRELRAAYDELGKAMDGGEGNSWSASRHTPRSRAAACP